MVNDIIEELMDPDMEPKPMSLCWTRTCKEEDVTTPERQSGTCLSNRCSMSWATGFGGMGRESRGLKRRFGKDWGSGGVTGTSSARRVYP